MSPGQPRWWEYEQSGPIAVEGGIKARSKRGAIGEQWWSRRFLGVLESYGMSGRLQRGRSYARRGQVIEFSLGTGKVTARVQGSRPQPYNVSITVLPLTSAQWREVETRLASQALFRARLLAGEMPAEIEEVFAACGTPLFPRSGADLEMRCSCPDWGVPCKHLAAVCYVLAESFDDDPFAMLAWRGKGRDELLAALRGKSPGSPGSPGGAGGGTGETRAGDEPGHGAARGRDWASARGVPRGLLVAWAEPGQAARAAREPGGAARPAAQARRPAAGAGARRGTAGHTRPRLPTARRAVRRGRSGGGAGAARRASRSTIGMNSSTSMEAPGICRCGWPSRMVSTSSAEPGLDDGEAAHVAVARGAGPDVRGVRERRAEVGERVADLAPPGLPRGRAGLKLLRGGAGHLVARGHGRAVKDHELGHRDLLFRWPPRAASAGDTTRRFWNTPQRGRHPSRRPRAGLGPTSHRPRAAKPAGARPGSSRRTPPPGARRRTDAAGRARTAGRPWGCAG